jgi:hypothetical protein
VTAKRERMTRLDWHHSGLRVDYLYGPLQVPSRDAFVAALTKIAQTSALPRVGADIAPDRRSRLRDPQRLREWAEGVVTEISGDGLDDFIATYAERASSEPTADAMRFTLSPNHVLFSGDHSLGDSSILMRMAPAVLAVAAGDPLPEWLTHPEPRSSLLRALWRTFGAHPSRVREVLGGRRGDSGVDGDPGPMRPWTPDPAISTTTVSSARFAELRGAHSTPARKVPASGSLLALIRSAFEAESIALSDTSWIPIDARRYLAPGTEMVGNFAPQVQITASEGATAGDFADQLSHALGSGRPLVGLTLSTLRAPVAFAPPTTVAAQTLAEVTVTTIPRRDEIDSLRWQSPETGWVFASTAPGIEPHSVRVVIVVTRAGATISAAYHQNVFDRAQVERALARLSGGDIRPLVTSYETPARPE